MKTILTKLFIFWNRIRVIMYIPAYYLQKTEKYLHCFILAIRMIYFMYMVQGWQEKISTKKILSICLMNIS